MFSGSSLEDDDDSFVLICFAFCISILFNKSRFNDTICLVTILRVSFPSKSTGLSIAPVFSDGTIRITCLFVLGKNRLITHLSSTLMGLSPG